MTSALSSLRTLDLASMQVAYVEHGPATDATPLVLLHGGALDHRMWTPQLGAFPGRRVIAPDARGHGRSSRQHAPYRPCDDVVALLDALDIPRAVLVGLSMGGSTAVDVALEHPGRVAGLVVVGAGTSEPDFQDPWTLDIMATWQRTQAAGDMEGWIEAFLRFLPGPHRRMHEVDQEVARLLDRMVRDTLTAQLVVDETGTPRPPVPPTPVRDTWGRLPGIEVPVLAVVGALDADDHLRMAKTVAESVRHGELVRIDGAAHYPNLERPEEFNSALARLESWQL